MSKPDINLTSICGKRPLGTVVIDDTFAIPTTHSDTLKITDCADGVVMAGHVAGGKEDCLDVNNHTENVSVVAMLWEPRGKYLCTIKGGSRNITVVGKVRGHGSVVDVDLGNISDQSDDRTTGIALGLTHESGDVITVRCLHADKPILTNPEQRYRIVFYMPPLCGSLFTKAYKFLKRLGLPI